MERRNGNTVLRSETLPDSLPTFAEVRRIDQWCDRMIQKHGWKWGDSLRRRINSDAQIALARREEAEV